MRPGVVKSLPQTRQVYFLLSLGLWPCSLSHFLLHAVMRDVGPEGAAADDKPQGQAADDKLEGPASNTEGTGTDDKLDGFNKSCALV